MFGSFSWKCLFLFDGFSKECICFINCHLCLARKAAADKDFLIERDGKWGVNFFKVFIKALINISFSSRQLHASGGDSVFSGDSQGSCLAILII